MRKLTVFESVSLDGYFVDARGDMSWAHASSAGDPEWARFTSENARGGRGTLLFGRRTYELMAGFWTTEAARQQMPEVAEGMARMEKLVVSRTLEQVGWTNASLLRGDLLERIAAMKQGSGEPILVMGSGTIVAQLARAGLIDGYTFVIAPILLGGGRTLFEGLDHAVALRRVSERTFENGNIVATYEPR
ncbi:dihydrofolate reductase family protein [Sorangium sp. So ce1036]|uniref:dihydrofolate reductase family protein n=1 Tax=Sorangium sp. So ce1036 TaxID=3133328 RepID=UPI003F0E407A